MNGRLAGDSAAARSGRAYGLIFGRGIQPPWALVVAITGLGALLAIGWELGEYEAFIHQGKELTGAYRDTLGDEAMGSLGSLVAGLIVARSAKPSRPVHDHVSSDRQGRPKDT